MNSFFVFVHENLNQMYVYLIAINKSRAIKIVKDKGEYEKIQPKGEKGREDWDNC